jgi:hypothetical protein
MNPGSMVWEPECNTTVVNDIRQNNNKAPQLGEK